MTSSCPTERLFSDAGQVLTEKRSRLEPDLLADLVFCGENLDLVRDKSTDGGTVGDHEIDGSAISTAGLTSASKPTKRSTLHRPSTNVLELLKRRKMELDSKKEGANIQEVVEVDLDLPGQPSSIRCAAKQQQ